MAYKCVVGNCRQPDDKVERCYWNQSNYATDPWAYLDLCWYHQEMMKSSARTVIVDGWDPL